MVRLYNFKNKNQIIKCADFNGLIDQYNFVAKEFKEKRFNTVRMQEEDEITLGGVNTVYPKHYKECFMVFKILQNIF